MSRERLRNAEIQKNHKIFIIFITMTDTQTDYTVTGPKGDSKGP